MFYEGSGIVQSFLTGPWSLIISLWQVQVVNIASLVPIPDPLGSPLGPNL